MSTISDNRDALMSVEVSSFVFGPFQLFPRRRVLLKYGRRVELGDRAIDLLIILVERPGDVISKDELISRAWPNVFVEEISLRVNISSLRRALGDDRSNTIYVKNIVGRGYSFVEDVTTNSTAFYPEKIDRPSEHYGQLPFLAHGLIGREASIQSLTTELTQHRLVSLVGGAGIGKTAVALAVAKTLATQFFRSVRIIDFSDVENASDALPVMEGGHHLSCREGDRKIYDPQTDPILIVLDNCDHVIDATAQLANDIRKMAPGVHILATSREPLRVDGEQVHRLPPLDFPSSGKNLTISDAMAFSAVEFFVERACAIDDQFELRESEIEAIVDICNRAEGVPLALEFAVGYVEMFGLTELATVLDEQRLLAARGHRGVRASQRTLKATLGRSFDILSPTDKTVLKRLATLRGAFTMASAMTAAPEFGKDEVFASVVNLADKSLLTVDTALGEARYRLQEVMRAFLS